MNKYMYKVNNIIEFLHRKSAISNLMLRRKIPFPDDFPIRPILHVFTFRMDYIFLLKQFNFHARTDWNINVIYEMFRII